MQAPKALDTIGELARRGAGSEAPASGRGMGRDGSDGGLACMLPACRPGPQNGRAHSLPVPALLPPLPSPRLARGAGKNLQAQYERWQPRAKYRMHLDPTTEDVKKLAISCRRTAKVRWVTGAGGGLRRGRAPGRARPGAAAAKCGLRGLPPPAAPLPPHLVQPPTARPPTPDPQGERVLFHYNGHGVPRPTANGEVWVFNKSYTQYIPLSLYDLQARAGALLPGSHCLGWVVGAAAC